MGKNGIIASVAARAGVPKTVCQNVIDALKDEIMYTLVSGERVIIRDFMSVEVGEHAARHARNPKTGEMEDFPAVKTVKCRMAKQFKDAINELD